MEWSTNESSCRELASAHGLGTVHLKRVASAVWWEGTVPSIVLLPYPTTPLPSVGDQRFNVKPLDVSCIQHMRMMVDKEQERNTYAAFHKSSALQIRPSMLNISALSRYPNIIGRTVFVYRETLESELKPEPIVPRFSQSWGRCKLF